MLRYKEKERCHYRVFFFKEMKGTHGADMYNSCGIKVSAFPWSWTKSQLQSNFGRFSPIKGAREETAGKKKKQRLQNKTLQSKQTHNDAASKMWPLHVSALGGFHWGFHSVQQKKKKEGKKTPGRWTDCDCCTCLTDSETNPIISGL